MLRVMQGIDLTKIKFMGCAYEPRGQEFESLRARQNTRKAGSIKGPAFLHCGRGEWLRRQTPDIENANRPTRTGPGVFAERPHTNGCGTPGTAVHLLAHPFKRPASLRVLFVCTA